MTTLKVEDMHCEKCVARITNVLNDAGIEFAVSLADKTVTITGGDVAKAVEELDDIGFEAKEI